MLGRGAKDKEHAMSQKLESAIAVIGIDRLDQPLKIRSDQTARPIASVVCLQSPRVPIQEHRECYLAHDPCSAADPPAKIMLDAPIADCTW